MAFEFSRLTTTSVLGTSASVISKNLPSFGAIAALLMATNCSIALVLDIPTAVRTNQFGSHYWTWTLALGLLGQLATAMIVYVTYQSMRDRRVGVATVLRQAVANLPMGLAAGFVVALVVVLGTAALIVPGYMAAAAYCVAVPVAVVEHSSPGSSLSRSAALTKGYRWTAFGITFITGLLAVLVLFSLIALAQGAGSVAFALIYSGFGTAFQVWQAVSVAVIYHHLRVLKEGVDIEQIAAVFD